MALDYHYAEQMIYWTDVTTQGSMIRRMHMNGSNVEVRLRFLLSGGKGGVVLRVLLICVPAWSLL